MIIDLGWLSPPRSEADLDRRFPDITAAECFRNARRFDTIDVALGVVYALLGLAYLALSIEGWKLNDRAMCEALAEGA